MAAAQFAAHRIVSVSSQVVQFRDFYTLELTAVDADGSVFSVLLYSEQPLSIKDNGMHRAITQPAQADEVTA